MDKQIIDRKKLEQYIRELKIGSETMAESVWYDRALQDVIDAIDMFGFEPDYKINPKYDSLKYGNPVIKKLFYSDIFNKPRRKLFSYAYEQGRFDEWIEKEYGLGRYQKIE